MSNAVWGQDGSSNQAPVRRKTSPVGLVILILGAVVALAGGIWKVIQTFGDQVTASVTEEGNQFTAADLSLGLIVIGFVLIFIGGFAISKASKSRR